MVFNYISTDYVNFLCFLSCTEKEKPKIYPPEFRESSVKLAIESDQSIAQTAKELGINPNTLHTWISKYSKPSQSRPVAKRTDEHLYDELKRLKQACRYLVIDFGTSKSPKSTRQRDNHYCPGRPASVPLRHTFVNSALATQHSLK